MVEPDVARLHAVTIKSCEGEDSSQIEAIGIKVSELQRRCAGPKPKPTIRWEALGSWPSRLDILVSGVGIRRGGKPCPTPDAATSSRCLAAQRRGRSRRGRSRQERLLRL